MMVDLHMTIDGFYSFLDAASFFVQATDRVTERVTD
jgi:hypothetical protein